MGAPGITPAQREALIETIDKMVKSPAWAEVLKQKGWDDAYLRRRRVRGVPEAGAGARRRRS